MLAHTLSSTNVVARSTTDSRWTWSWTNVSIDLRRPGRLLAPQKVGYQSLRSVSRGELPDRGERLVDVPALQVLSGQHLANELFGFRVPLTRADEGGLLNVASWVQVKRRIEIAADRQCKNQNANEGGDMEPILRE